MDSVIKLFGKTIHLTTIREAPNTAGEDSGGYEKKLQVLLNNQYNHHEPKQPNEETRIHQEDATNDYQNLSETMEEKNNDQQSKNSNNPTVKTLKKPDKILPCPRCKSMDTKFCYFNNYNVNQPRHFCKNCQRYWTDGGSMRNVPVGAGRRKSKSSTANHHYQYYQHITIPDCVQADFFEPINHPSPLKLNGTVLNFGESNLSRSMVTALNSNETRNKALNSKVHAFPPYINDTPWSTPWKHTPFYVPWRCSGLNSTVLGKRSREGNTLNHGNSESEHLAESDKCLSLPKTLKIDGHEKAAKRSVLVKLGFEKDEDDGVVKKRSTEASQILCANPAALSRSLRFQERS